MINIDDCEENSSDSSMSQTHNTIILHIYIFVLINCIVNCIKTFKTPS